ncbi:carboxypeptidase B-like [Saccoglossus kowalevskii]
MTPVKFQVIRVIPRYEDELETLRQIERGHADEISFWKEPTMTDRFVDIMVTPDFVDGLCSMLQTAEMKYFTNIYNVQEVIDRERELMRSRPRENEDEFDYGTYHRYDEINKWVDDFVAANLKISSVFTIGNTYEGRELRGVKIGRPGENKPAIWMEGGIHAREWISPATMLYMTQLFADGYGDDQTTTKLVDELDWYMLPLLNADGYEFTHTDDRMWRKTRRPNDGYNCIGTDANRNFGYMWGGEGASAMPCAYNYRGSHPHSEVEVEAVTKFIINDPNFKGFVDFHSYGQMWMSPWGYTYDKTPDYDYQNEVNRRCVEALEAVHGTDYIYGPSSSLYLAAGGSEDWTYGAAGIVLSHAVELRDKDGFILPEEEIIPCGEETFAGIRELGLAVLEG